MPNPVDRSRRAAHRAVSYDVRVTVCKFTVQDNQQQRRRMVVERGTMLRVSRVSGFPIDQNLPDSTLHTLTSFLAFHAATQKCVVVSLSMSHIDDDSQADGRCLAAAQRPNTTCRSCRARSKPPACQNEIAPGGLAGTPAPRRKCSSCVLARPLHAFS